MCYTRSERRSDQRGTASTFEDILRLNTAENCTTLALRTKILEYYAEVEPQTKGWRTDDLPMWLWFAAT